MIRLTNSELMSADGGLTMTSVPEFETMKQAGIPAADDKSSAIRRAVFHRGISAATVFGM